MQITEPKKTYPWIQVLRAVAALMVLFFHLQPHWDLVPVLSRFGEWTRWGFSGVDVFFVLSGFVVYRSARSAQGNLGVPAFLWKRFSRIYFGYWPVFIVVTVIVRAASMRELLPADEMVGSFFLLYPNIWKNWIPTAWSLTFELMFYTWITAFVFFARNAVKAIVVAILLLVVWNAGWLAMNRELVHAGHQPLRYLLTGLGIEFLLGALVFEFYSRNRALFKNFFIVSALSLAVMVVSLSAGTVSPWFDRVEILRVATFGLFGVSCLIFVLALGETDAKPPDILVRIGDASYSLYLLHPFLLGWSGSFRERAVGDSFALLVAFVLLLPVVIVLISLLWFRLVEAPSVRFSASLFGNRVRLVK